MRDEVPTVTYFNRRHEPVADATSEGAFYAIKHEQWSSYGNSITHKRTVWLLSDPTTTMTGNKVKLREWVDSQL